MPKGFDQVSCSALLLAALSSVRFLRSAVKAYDCCTGTEKPEKAQAAKGVPLPAEETESWLSALMSKP